ncbi:hypothetical protein PIROE2DRAFT_16245 [Piromyces sp. E2]|nr:hypothetical protein PIROE2DRAFT_16245 [Piromyces sp. E2]|eukprot:OUM58456.1 hypothetical protein PIROE2DRAFT_16245 [Piromyces sp. E2]
MQQIIELANLRNNIYNENIDSYQVISDIIHWVLRSCGDTIFYFIPLREYIPDHYWPYSTEIWYKSAALGNVFWLTGEIIADWYPLLRTKAVTNNNRRKIKYVYVTCILYNIIKIINIYCYFIDYPINLSIRDKNGKVVTDYAMFKIRWWIIVFIMNIISCFYDISVILSLRKCIFNKLKKSNDKNENTFISKFKQISEFRIICSMIASIIFLPIILLFVIYLLHTLKKVKNEPNIPSDETIDYLRRVVLNVNYNLMYIDQILLKCYVERSNSKIPNNSINAYNYDTSYNFGSPSFHSSINKSYISNNSLNLSSPENSSIIYNHNYDTSKSYLIDNNNININNVHNNYLLEYFDINKNNAYTNNNNMNNNCYNNNDMNKKNKRKNNINNSTNKNQKNSYKNNKNNNSNYTKNDDSYYLKNDSNYTKNDDSNYTKNNDSYYFKNNDSYYSNNNDSYYYSRNYDSHYSKTKESNKKYNEYLKSKTISEEETFSSPPDNFLLKKFDDTYNTVRNKSYIIKDERRNTNMKNSKSLIGYYYDNNSNPYLNYKY